MTALELAPRHQRPHTKYLTGARFVTMKLGVFYGPSGDLHGVEGLTTDLQQAAAAGFPSYWIPQMPMGIDALTALSVAGAAVPEIELGTAVVPTYPRHPLVLAQQASTVSSVIGDRLALGIGLSHKVVIEKQYGMDFDKPVRHMREYLEVLKPALDQEAVKYQGDTISAGNPPMLPGTARPSILVAALGPQMLKVTGRLADGTITWMTGTTTLAEHTRPTIDEAAEAAGQARPRVVAGVPVACTDDVEGTRERAAKAFSIYGRLPSYRAMLDREGLAGPEDFCIIGNEDQVATELQAIFDAGADDVICSEFSTTPEDNARTRACLTSLL